MFFNTIIIRYIPYIDILYRYNNNQAISKLRQDFIIIIIIILIIQSQLDVLFLINLMTKEKELTLNQLSINLSESVQKLERKK